MKKKKVYSSDFKLQLVKKYLNSNKTMRELSDEYSVPLNNISSGVSKYQESNYDDSVFDTKKGRPQPIISDYSKIPPIIYGAAGIDRSDNYRDSDNTFFLKRKLEYYEKILLEKEIQLKIVQDEIELLKKRTTSKFHLHRLFTFNF